MEVAPLYCSINGLWTVICSVVYLLFFFGFSFLIGLSHLSQLFLPLSRVLLRTPCCLVIFSSQSLFDFLFFFLSFIRFFLSFWSFFYLLSISFSISLSISQSLSLSLPVVVVSQFVFVFFVFLFFEKKHFVEFLFVRLIVVLFPVTRSPPLFFVVRGLVVPCCVC